MQNMGRYNLSQELQWPGKRNFFSYVSAFVFYLNSIRIQDERFHRIHESYNTYEYNDDLSDYYSRVNISQDEYFTQMSLFYHEQNSNVYVTTFELIDAAFELEDDEVPVTENKNVIMTFNLSEQVNASDIVGVEVRMLMPPVEPGENPAAISPLLNIYDLNTKNKISEHRVWLSRYTEKWISVSGPNLVEAVQKWIMRRDQEWYINITDLSDIPIEAYINLVVDDPDPQGCRWRCNENQGNPAECDWVRKTPEPFGIHCCWEEIPFGKDLNKFGVDMTMLTDIFFAPMGLTYTFCKSKSYVKPTSSCTSTKYQHNHLLTPHWDFPWLLTKTRINVNLTDCNCTKCEFADHVQSIPDDRSKVMLIQN